MKVLLAAVVVTGVSVSVAAMFIGIDQHDVLGRFVMGARSGGFTIAACAVFVWLLVAPALRRAGRLRREFPDDVVLVCQRAPGLVEGLLRRKHVDFAEIGRRIPWYYVLRATRGRLEIWSSRAKLVSIRGSDILEIRTSVAMLARRQPCLTMSIRAESGAPSQIDLPIGHDRWEAMATSNTQELQRVADRLTTAIDRTRV